MPGKKKPRDNVSHIRVSSIGNDYCSSGYGEIERTNPAEIAIKVVNLCAEDLLGIHKDDPETDHEKRDFFMAVGMTLLQMAQPNDECMYRPLVRTLECWKQALNDYEDDKKKHDEKKAELDAVQEDVPKHHEDILKNIGWMWKEMQRLHVIVRGNVEQIMSQEILDMVGEVSKLVDKINDKEREEKNAETIESEKTE